MKRLLLPMVLCSLVLVANLSAQIKVNSSGYVGINNTNPAYRLDVAGTVKMAHNSNTIQFDGSAFYANVGFPSLGTSGSPWYQFYAAQAYLYQDPIIISEMNLKKNITNITMVKDKVKLLRPVTYNLSDDAGFLKEQPVKNLQYGFIAQELQELFPDLVVKRDDGVLGIQYTGLIPVLVQAIKEQQVEIDDLTKRISELEKRLQ